MKSNIVKVLDFNTVLPISFEACRLYHGPDRIAGLSIGFMVMQYGLQQLCGEEIPERDKIEVRTAFPGPGFRDAVEMISRAVTKGRFTLLQSELTRGPDGVIGKMYFEIKYCEKKICLALKEGVLTQEILEAGRAALKEGSTKEARDKWDEIKKVVSAKVWESEPEDLLDIL